MTAASAKSGITSRRLASGNQFHFVVERAVKDPLKHPEQVGGRQDHSENADSGNRCPDLETAGKHHIFRDEARQARQAKRSQTRKCEECCQHGHLLRNAAKDGDFAGVSMIVDDTDAEEQHAGNDTMAEHLDGRPRQGRHTEGDIANTGSRGHTKQNNTHVADTGIGDKLLHILLHQADTRAIDDINDGQDRQPARELVDTLRQTASGRCGSSHRHPSSAGYLPG